MLEALYSVQQQWAELFLHLPGIDKTTQD